MKFKALAQKFQRRFARFKGPTAIAEVSPAIHTENPQLLQDVGKARITRMATSTILLPGEEIPADQLPKSKKGTLTLGPGLRHIPPKSILTTSSGSLHVDHKKPALWIEHEHGRYQPSVGDLVVAQIHHASTDTWHCSLTPHTPFALLGHLAFEGATRKTRPKLEADEVVYARVSRCSKWEDTELECVNSNTGKAEGMGPLKGGMLFNISPAFARRLMMGIDRKGRSKGGVVVLEDVGEKAKFEVAVGRNGKVWVHSGSVWSTVTIGLLLQRTDEQKWDVERQRMEIKRALKDV